MHDFPRAVESQRRNVQLREKVVASNPDDFRAADRLAYALHFVAYMEHLQGDQAGASRDYRRAVNLYGGLRRRGTLVPQSLHTYALGLDALSHIQKALGRTAEACGLLIISADVLAEYQRRATVTADDLQQIHATRQAIRSCP